MTLSAAGARLTGDRIVCADSMSRALLEIASRAVRRRPVGGLDRVPVLGRHGRMPQPLRDDAVAAEAWSAAIPGEAMAALDPGAIAEWIVGHYTARAYPAVVLGSPHGGAVHLAAALGAAWLPAGFTVSVRRPAGAIGDWEGASRLGAEIADRIARTADVAISQVHDPVGRGAAAGTTLTFHVRWRSLPEAYRRFLGTRLDESAGCLLVRDVRHWPVSRTGDRLHFQIGSPAHGRSPDGYTTGDPGFRGLLDGLGARGWAPAAGLTTGFAESSVEPGFGADLRRTGRPCHQLIYSDAQALSGAVADVHRLLLGGQDAVVGCERLLDPWHTLATGAVPYWCETASRPAALAAETWVAGSRRYESITVLPQPPGVVSDAHADLAQWRSVTRFARCRGEVNRRAAHRYPRLPLPVSGAVRPGAPAGPIPAPVPIDLIVAGLHRSVPVSGLLVM